jgi:hypothetical protein
MYKQSILIFIVMIIPSLILFASCEKDKISGDVITDPRLLSELYSESVDTLLFQSNKYILETYLYRDFFPGGPIPRKCPLIALIFLVNIDSIPVSEDIEISRLYVINDQQIWISTPGDGGQPNIPVFKLQKLNNNGPKWDTNIYVNVIVEILVKSSSIKYFLIARNQYIEREE